MICEDIETAVLNWYADHCGDPALVAQIRSAVPGKRDVTSIGFFTTLLIPDAVPQFSTSSRDGVAFQGCALFAPELAPYADCILHSVGGRISSLEVYAVGDGHPLRVSRVEVRGVEGNFVDMRDA
jgi:hypothetical protein